MKKNFKLIVISVAIATLFITCDMSSDIMNDGGDIIIFNAMLYGYNEVPSNLSAATGSTTLTFNEVTKRFTAVTTYTGLTPIAGHIHNAAEGMNGEIVFTFAITSPTAGDLNSAVEGVNGVIQLTASPIIFESDVLTVEQIEELFSGRMYVNLHTVEFPGGEIRGQLIKQ